MVVSPRRTVPSIGFIVILFVFTHCAGTVPPRILPRFDAAPGAPHGLAFSRLPSRWDEGLPLGNGLLGELVWANGPFVRLSLDRADLWDLRPMKNLDIPEWKYKWVVEQWRKGDYRPVQERFDAPYDAEPAPSKIPAAALEMDASGWGEASEAGLTIENALGIVRWKDGKTLETFVHASKSVGWFRLKGAPRDFKPLLRRPAYETDNQTAAAADPVGGADLRRLGYKLGPIQETPDFLIYRQDGWGGFYYFVAVGWRRTAADVVEGVWSISTKLSDEQREPGAADQVLAELRTGFDAALAEHARWWSAFWSRSSVRLPDPLLEKQWYLEQYKFGSAARRGAPPISLQAVWTADNGKLPPWKGDFHHDLNTQLSYWPCYAADHLEEGLGFLDWLWDRRPEFERYTRSYFGTDGLNVPGVSTLDGRPMGGWIQYAFSPTVGAWLAQHFYLHWRFSRDRAFLAERAYPWIRAVAVHLEQLSIGDKNGKRRLPASSSPEIFDNSAGAWFAETTNYDLALIRWTFDKAAELAGELDLKKESAYWRETGSRWPEFAVDPQSGFMFAPGLPYAQSHRHFSHLMAFHPLGLIDMANGPADEAIIRRTLATLDRIGPDEWCGYSYAWLANLKARAFDGEGAAKALTDFASSFCLPNSFHANGDQSGTGKSKFTYRPFTLEGNFAFAAGLQEMLLQSHTGAIRVFPAVPAAWADASFDGWRADGAFLVSARRSGGRTVEIRIRAEKGGTLKLVNPFGGKFRLDGNEVRESRPIIELKTKRGQALTFNAFD
jgi:alpha-L-fucosidase 2